MFPAILVTPLKYISHSRRAILHAKDYGWFPGARYTNLRDIRGVQFERIGFIDIDWKNYNFERHLAAVAETRPRLTVARDIEQIGELDRVLREAELLKQYADSIVIVPKCSRMKHRVEALIPPCYLLGYSVPTKYGHTDLPLTDFRRPVHLLGGRPDYQRKLGNWLSVHSLDCNRFTLDAKFGDYFHGTGFRPHPEGGYDRCIRESLKNINKLWSNYSAPITDSEGATFQ